MADVLSQSQIDALLKSMSADAPAQEKKTESVQPLSPEERTILNTTFSARGNSQKKMKILRSVFENYARILTSQINGIFPRDDGHNGTGCTGKKVLRIRKCPSRKRLHDK